jgi:poly(beta-D-mannuronate) lyase
MIVTQAVTHLPSKEPAVTVAQIHDAASDLIMVVLRGSKLLVEGDNNSYGTLDPSYGLGTKYTLKIVASGGKIEIYYNDMSSPKVTVSSRTSGCYFKAGAYIQTNDSRGEPAGSYGEVVIYDLKLTHG